MPNVVELELDGEFIGFGNTDDVQIWEWNNKQWTIENNQVGIIGRSF